MSLRVGLGFLFLAVFLLISASFGVTSWIMNTQSHDASVINLAGRQRMLLQQITQDVLQIQHRGSQTDRQGLKRSIDIFDQTLRALIGGGEAPYLPGQVFSLPATRSPDVLAKLREVQSNWITFRAHLDTIATEAPGSVSFSAAVQLVQRGSPVLEQQADAVVRMYETVSTQKVVRLQWIQIVFFICALVLLTTGSLATIRMVVDPLGALERAAERIGSGKLNESVTLAGPHELMALAHSFDEMRVQLKASKEGLETRVERRTRELAALYEVIQEISSRLEPDYVLRSVTDKARQLLDGEVAFICLLDETSETLRLEAISGPHETVIGASVSSQQPFARQVLMREAALSCNTVGCEGSCGIIAPRFRASHLASPLRVGTCTIGALCVGSSKAATFSGQEAQLLTKLANSAAIALENARLYQQAERVAMLEERQRIAAEMHDGLAQSLSYLELKTEQLSDYLETGRDAEATAELQRIRSALHQSGHEVRQSITSLREGSLLRQSLQDRLTSAADEFVKAGETPIDLRIELDSSLAIPPDEAEQAFRVVQEALQNVRRHAQARLVTIRLESRETQFAIRVEDDGVGFDPEAPSLDGNDHFGISIMRARAARIGGQITLRSQPHKGTQMTLAWSAQNGANGSKPGGQTR
ncbi:MAG: type IV pili methyl-accepting chemotaxis transducer N-terminal domain-containing protein [Anaerolineae bacterium]|nr:type IV pili methyl-accepting chemotaxis transducer N-terminal domain-containing protein [Anaerolineae bacterium]NUQ04561.1 type IV pili methyl-accepting chemotaxis transducer N-terminal domain-containing protein [Anaerolineae bacterium]